MSRTTQDILALLRGLQIVANAAVKENEACFKHIWANSSIKEILESNLKYSKEYADKFKSNPQQELEKLRNLLKETKERSCVAFEGVKQLSSVQTTNPVKDVEVGSNPHKLVAGSKGDLDISSITLKELEEILSKRNKDRQVSLRLATTKTIQADESTEKNEKPISVPPPKSQLEDETYVENVMKIVTTISKKDTPQETVSTSEQPEIDLPKLSSIAKQRKVPSTRIARIASFGGLFAGLGVGTINELTKGALGLGGSKSVKEALFSPANTERIVDTLCRVRGAALKIGQILSIQDSNLLSPHLVKAFERVRQAADYMPDWQVEKVLVNELGSDWRDRLESFDETPFAAASIGQVHRAVLKDGMQVAIKIQYPGVARSIESDIDNLVTMMKIWDAFPKGFFIDNIVKVAKRELNWEVDYTREAEYTEKFKEMISLYPEYYVPKVIKDMTTRSVLTTELVPGLPLDKCFGFSYDHRKFIAESTLKLCIRELFELQCMQTDPNWSNFLYDPNSRRLMLIDFGSTRFYTRDFIRDYREIIIAAASDDPKKVLDYSKKMGFLTGYETKQMEEAHVNAVMILGEMFRYDGEFDFGKQNTTERIAQLVPTMVTHRLCPPPEEIYSIHRKLSGVFLLCARLNVKFNCRPFYEEIVLKKFKA